MSEDSLHIARDGEVLGEFTIAEIQSRLVAGELAPSDFYWNVYANGWSPLSEIIDRVESAPTKAPLPPPPAAKGRSEPKLGGILRNKLFLIGASAVVLIGLIVGGLYYSRNPKNTVIPANMETWDKTVVPSMNKLSEEDKRYLIAYMMRAKMKETFGKEKMEEGKTIGEAIAQEKQRREKESKEEADAALLRERLKAEKEAASQKLAEVLQVVFIEKGFQGSDFRSGRVRDAITVKLGFANKGTKDIAGFKGVAVFKDMFGDVVSSINLKYDDGIKVGVPISWDGVIDYNQFMDNDKKLRYTESDKLKFSFTPEAIIFADGTKMAAEEQ